MNKTQGKDACRLVQRLLIDLEPGTPLPDLIAEHVEVCEACREDLARTLRIKELLRGTADQDLPASLVDRLDSVAESTAVVGSTDLSQTNPRGTGSQRRLLHEAADQLTESLHSGRHGKPMIGLLLATAALIALAVLAADRRPRTRPHVESPLTVTPGRLGPDDQAGALGDGTAGAVMPLASSTPTQDAPSAIAGATLEYNVEEGYGGGSGPRDDWVARDVTPDWSQLATAAASAEDVAATAVAPERHELHGNWPLDLIGSMEWEHCEGVRSAIAHELAPVPVILYPDRVRAHYFGSSIYVCRISAVATEAEFTLDDVEAVVAGFANNGWSQTQVDDLSESNSMRTQLASELEQFEYQMINVEAHVVPLEPCSSIPRDRLCVDALAPSQRGIVLTVDGMQMIPPY